MRETMTVLTDRVRALLPDPSLEFLIGRERLAELGGTKRMVWWADGGEVQPTARKGPMGLTARPDLVLHPLYDLSLRVRAAISSPSALDVIWTQLLTATRDAFGACSKPGRFSIATDADQAASSRGTYSFMVQDFTWDLLICRATDRRHEGAFVTGLVTLSIQDFSFTLQESL